MPAARRIYIPARMDSKRFPGKPLVDIAGKPLLRRTYDTALLCGADSIHVVTPDKEIEEYCRRNGIPVFFDDTQQHANGTSRVMAAAAKLHAGPSGVAPDVVINWQVDEPLINAFDVQRMMESNSHVISTLVADRPSIFNPASLVTVRVSRGYCRWFSRVPPANDAPQPLAHIGIYRFSRCIPNLGEIDDCPWAQHEDLEQLAWIEKGWTIEAIQSKDEFPPPSVNTPEDASVVSRIYEEENDTWR